MPVLASTARRGVFADFADGNPVSTDDAKSSDTMDTVLIVAGVVVLVAIGLWITRLVAKQTDGGGLDLAGIALAGLGVLVVLVGLFLSGGITDADGQAAQGDKGVTATMVIGGGFLLVSLGLLIGTFTVRESRSKPAPAHAYQPTGPGHQLAARCSVPGSSVPPLISNFARRSGLTPSSRTVRAPRSRQLNER